MTRHSTLQNDDPNAPVTRGEFHGFKGEFYIFKQEMIVFKQEMIEFKDYVYRSLDHMTEILERLDQERIFTEEGLRRSEETSQNHETRITMLEQIITA